jgi:hypothetical protein
MTLIWRFTFKTEDLKCIHLSPPFRRAKNTLSHRILHICRIVSYVTSLWVPIRCFAKIVPKEAPFEVFDTSLLNAYHSFANAVLSYGHEGKYFGFCTALHHKIRKLRFHIQKEELWKLTTNVMTSNKFWISHVKFKKWFFKFRIVCFKCIC